MNPSLLLRSGKIPSPLLYGCRIALVVLSYYLAGMLGLSLAIPPGYATALWPPSGIALGVVLIGGYRLLPGVFLGSLFINLTTLGQAATQEEALTTLLIAGGVAVGSVLQTWVSAWIIRRWVGYPNPLTRNTEIFRFYGLAGPLGCLVNATWSLSLLFLVGKVSPDILLRNWLTWWLGDVIGVFVFTPVMLAFWGRPHGAWQFRRRALALPLMMSFGVTSLFFFYAQEAENRRQHSELMALTHSASDYVRSAVTSHLAQLYSLQDLFDATGTISPEAFARFTLPALQRNQGIQGFSWNVWVKQWQRKQHELTQQQNSGNPSFQITEKNSSGQFVRAGDYKDHVVVTYIEPHAKNAKALGYDVGSEPIRRAAIDRAVATGQISATAPIRLVQETGQQKGILIFLPVYRHPESAGGEHPDPDAIAGFVVEVLRIGDVIENALAVLGENRHLLKIEVHDRDSAGTDHYLYQDPSPVTTGAMTLNTELAVGGRTWELITTMAGELPGASLNTFYVLLGGVNFTALLGLLLMILSARTLGMEVMVRVRTSELSRQNRRLSDEIQHGLEVEGALRESESRFRSMADSAPVLVFTSTADDRRDYFNRQWQDFTGQSQPEDADDIRAWEDIFHPDDLGSYQTLRDQATREEMPFTINYRLRSAQGEYHWFLDSSAPRFGVDHRFMGFITCCIDISDIKASQAAMQTAKEAAEAANATKSEFMANMSHELLTPMNAILGLSQMLLEESPAPESRSPLEKIRLSAQNLLILLNTLLDFSSLETGTLKMAEAAFSSKTFLAELVDSTRQAATDKNLEFILREDSSIPEHLVGDASRLIQILANLLANAVKFTEQGQVGLETRLEKQADNQVWISFRISDTGIGMAPEQIEKLFTAFSQADGSSTRKYGGTGLGLTVAQRLVQQMGGDIKVDSTLGSGSVFTLTLPFQTVATVMAADSHVADAQDFHNKRILLVEDNPLNQLVAKRQLAKLHIITDLAENGREALERVKNAEVPYDAVLMDIQMPVMDGLEATRNLRSQFAAEILPIIAVSANTSDQDRANCRAVGMNDFIPKPLEHMELIRILGFWLHVHYNPIGHQ